MAGKIGTAAELREAWTRFWVSKGHTSVKSASLIPTHPSAPMFTNSGMMQFVPYFLGEETAPYTPPRASSIQRCVRAGGKHNDLDAIGRSLRHLSFFEMLGNFSFGDYFKKDAIVWAWEFVTEVLGIDRDRIWVTVHLSDDEAADIWHRDVGLPKERIQRLDKDNFWEMGETGPCGPSSELFYDFGAEYGPGGGPENPEAEHRYIEFWNLVFTQYFRDSAGELTPLANKNVDTGAGLERLVGLLRGSPSSYACDTVGDLVAEVETLTGCRLGTDPQRDVALRLIADHARSVTFLIADGVVPSNEDRGYVLRRIIRRAIRFAYLLDVQRHIMPQLAEHVVRMMGDAYPELRAQRDLIVRLLDREEAQFRRTLQTGLGILEAELGKLAPRGVLPGAIAFALHDTYGFPLEVTTEIVDDRGFSVDAEGFARHMTEQRARARAARKRTGVDDRHSAYQELLDRFGPTEFRGREESTVDARVLAVHDGKEGAEVFLDKTPFYAEQGGQVGDTGILTRKHDGSEFRVLDTVHAVPGLHLHRVKGKRGARLEPGDEVAAAIDVPRRLAIRRNHTGTHLLHWALREVLGKHVKQQGSLVAPDRLRFDFSHFEPVTHTQLQDIEDLVNREILTDGAVHHYETSQEEALEKGAIAFFGEKYGDRVRVLQAGAHSLELCGGIHVRALGEIGLLKVVAEGSIGSNLRRIEAVTGTGTLAHLRKAEQMLAEIAAETGVPAGQALSGVRKRLADLKAAQTDNKQLAQRLERALVEELLARNRGDVLVESVDDADAERLRNLAALVCKQGDLRAAVLGSINAAGKPVVVAAVGAGSGLHASQILEPVAKAMGGGFGKQREVAAAGARDPSRLPAALDEARAMLSSPQAASSGPR